MLLPGPKGAATEWRDLPTSSRIDELGRPPLRGLFLGTSRLVWVTLTPVGFLAEVYCIFCPERYTHQRSDALLNDGRWNVVVVLRAGEE
jgi:hypothetical protein